MKKFLLGFVVGGVLSPVLILGGTFAYFKYLAETRPESKLKAPVLPLTEADYGWTMHTVAGDEISFADFKGKPVFLTFFKPTCATCKSELPYIQSLYDQIENDDIAFAVVSVTEHSEEDWLKFMEENAITFPIYVAENGRPPMFQVGTVPVTFILDKEGRIATRYQGAAAWDDEASVNFLRGLALSGETPTGGE